MLGISLVFQGPKDGKLANFWNAVAAVFNLNKWVSADMMPFVCVGVALLVLLPACCYTMSDVPVDLFWARPNRSLRTSWTGSGNFAALLFISSMSFLLFSNQVHEMAVLFPCAAACLLPLASRSEPIVAYILQFLLVSVFSMYPLVVKDKLYGPYIAACVVLVAFSEAAPASTLNGWLNSRWLSRSTSALIACSHLIYASDLPIFTHRADDRLLLITGSSCSYFLCSLVLVTLLQYRGTFGCTGRGKTGRIIDASKVQAADKKQD